LDPYATQRHYVLIIVMALVLVIITMVLVTVFLIGLAKDARHFFVVSVTNIAKLAQRVHAFGAKQVITLLELKVKFADLAMTLILDVLDVPVNWGALYVQILP
jgi:hypothetical protein